MNATKADFCHVATYLKSLTHMFFGAGVWNWRFTLSYRQGSAMSGIVVLDFLPRMTPSNPIPFFRRATVQRAMSKPSRGIH